VNLSWTLPGSRRFVPYEAPQGRRVNVIAALAADGPCPALAWTCMSRTLKAEDLLAFVERTLPKGPGLQVVVLDNASIHRDRRVQAARRALRRQGIVLYYLPPYSPELNAIEAWFGGIKQHDLPRRSYPELKELIQAIDDAFANARQRLVSRSEHKFGPAA
jgi:putative transposase